MERITGWIAWHLPRSVVYHALIRAWAHATTGQWSDTEAPAVTADEVIRRWEIAARKTAGEEKPSE